MQASVRFVSGRTSSSWHLTRCTGPLASGTFRPMSLVVSAWLTTWSLRCDRHLARHELRPLAPPRRDFRDWRHERPVPRADRPRMTDRALLARARAALPGG